jgi:hypothetical protein
MLIKEITTNIKIPYNIFQTNQNCFNVLNEISNNIFSNMNTNLLNGGKNKKKNIKIKIKIKTLKKKYKKRTFKKYKKSKKYYKLKGGTTGIQLFMLIIIFLTFNFLTTDSLLFTSDSNVIKRIVEVGENSLFFKNSKGTCATNILFFLKIFSLETHVFNLLHTVKMNNAKIEKQLSINATLKTTWVEFSLFDVLDDTIPESKDKDQIIHEQFNSMIQTNEGKNELIKLYIGKLQKICSSIGKRGFITLLIYPTTSSINHAVALWYTETGNIIIIDPQLFYYYKSIEIYSDVNNDFEKYNAGSGIRVYSLTKYIADNIEYDINQSFYLLQAKHVELSNNITELSYVNPYYKEGLKLLKNNKLDL